MLLPSHLLLWTKQLIKQHKLRLNRRCGQHFLVDKKVLQQIIRAAELPPAAPVLEVGGGLGVLTLALLEQGARVATVELDRTLGAALQGLDASTGSLNVLVGDILKIPDSGLQQALNIKASDDFWLVANLPYDISGRFLRRFLSGEWRPRIMVLLLQREVAERLVAKPGQFSLLTLQARLASEVKIINKVKPGAFYPPPQVTSAIVKFKLRTPAERQALLGSLAEERLWRLARAGFSARRKYLLNNLARQLHFKKLDLILTWQKLNLPARVRAQELTLEQWLELARSLNKELQ